MAVVVAGVTGAALLAPAGSALAQSAPRQSATVVFTEKATAAPTGATVKIRYRDAGNAEGKPPAVQRIVTSFAPGTVIDTAVPDTCGASDARLMSEGRAACAPGSVVGGGAVTLDTGAPGARFVENELTLLNNAGELIMLTEVRGSSPPTRAVVRGKVMANTIVSEIPPVPGGGPDGFTAIRDVDFKVSSISNRVGGTVRAYLSTPASCPGTRRFANAFTFTYRDGVAQDVPSPSACTALDQSRLRSGWLECHSRAAPRVPCGPGSGRSTRRGCWWGCA